MTKRVDIRKLLGEPVTRARVMQSLERGVIAVGRDGTRPVLPTHCFDCGVVLLAGWTRHKEGCSILELIREAEK